MAKKKCSTCEKTKPSSDFSWRNKNKGSKHSQCKACVNLHKRKLYAKSEENRHYYRDKQSERRKANKKVVQEWRHSYMSDKVCEACGLSNVDVLTFHHKDPAQKTANISRMFTGWYSIDRIVIEIEKCKILCSNCHIILHAEQRRALIG